MLYYHCIISLDSRNYQRFHQNLTFTYCCFLLPWSVFQDREIIRWRIFTNMFHYKNKWGITIYFCVNISFI